MSTSGSRSRKVLEVAPDLQQPRVDHYRRAMESGEPCTFETFGEPFGVPGSRRAPIGARKACPSISRHHFKNQAEQALKKSEHASVTCSSRRPQHHHRRL